MGKRIKKVVLLNSLIILALVFVGCSSTGENVKNIGKVDIYEPLNAAIKSPNSQMSSDLSGDITFTAIILDEPYDMDFEEEPGKVYKYQTAMISRNTEDVFFVNVTDAEIFEPGDIVSITGNIKGLIYQTVDNSNIEVLDIIAKKIEKKELKNEEIEQSNTRIVDGFDRQGNLTIEKAFMVRPSEEEDIHNLMNDEIITLYLEYENTGDTDATPNASDMGRIYLGDTRFTRNGSPLGKQMKVDGDRINISLGMGDKTYPGKKQKYYVTLTARDKGEEKIDITKPLQFETYDDEFNLVEYYELPIEIIERDDERVK